MKKTAEEIFLNKLVHYNPSSFPSGMKKAFLKAMEEYATQPSDELPSDDKVNKQSKVSCKGNSHAMRYRHMLHQFREGAKWMRSLASPLLASKDARIKELEEALSQAVENIKVWHDADDVWDIYYNNAPEMKKIKNVLTPKP